MTLPLVLPRLPGRTVTDAKTFAMVAHAGQTDKVGRPYHEHLQRVSDLAVLLMPADSPAPLLDQAAQIGWLHDVIEDTGYTSAHLLEEGFHRDVVNAVRLLSKPHPYARYLDWIADISLRASVVEIVVKLADNLDNSDLARLVELPPSDAARLVKQYADARVILLERRASLGFKG